MLKDEIIIKEKISEEDMKRLKDTSGLVVKIYSFKGLNKKIINEFNESNSYYIGGDLFSEKIAYYTKSQILEIIEMMSLIKEEISTQKDERLRFLNMCKILGIAIEYDERGCRSKPEKYVKQRAIDSRSLYSIFLDGGAVCYGVAIALFHCGQFCDFDVKIVHGISKKTSIGHAWNQVSFDGGKTGYNCDLTTDLHRIKEGEAPNFGLVSDGVMEKYFLNNNTDDCFVCRKNFLDAKLLKSIYNKLSPELMQKEQGIGLKSLLSDVLSSDIRSEQCNKIGNMVKKIRDIVESIWNKNEGRLRE